jgi:vacuolar-type H+-ATPase subunit I/STV1
MEEKDLVWLPKSVAVKVKQIETVEEADSMIQEYIKTKRQDFIRELENLDDDVLTFKGVCLKHRQELKKVYDEQADLLDKLWEDCGDMGSKIHRHAKAIAAELAPLTAEVKSLKTSIEEVKKLIHEVSFYPAQQFVSTVESVARMDDKTKGLLRDLLDLKKVTQEE